MYQPTTRVLTVLELLQARGELSGAEIAERLEISRRTVRRYITALQDLGIPVEGTRGRHGAYRLRPGFKLPPLIFSDEEALAVVVGLLAVRRLGLAITAADAEGALAKVERVVPPAVRQRVEAAGETLALDFAMTAAAAERTLVIAARQAAQERRQIVLRYRAWDGEETTRNVDPYGVVYRAQRWFMVGWCHLRGDLRTFRLDRAHSVALTDARFERPASFDPLAYLLGTLAEAPAIWIMDVVLDMPLAEAQRRIAPVLVTLTEEPDGVVLRGATSDLRFWAHLLAGLDCPLHIRAPVELRQAMHQLGLDIVALANHVDA